MTTENKTYELQEHTMDFEVVDICEFMQAYAKINYEQSYNHTKIKEYPDYLTISAPSPKSSYQGVHKTLVLKKGEEDPSLEEMIQCAIESGIQIGFRQGIEEVQKKIDTIKK